MIYTAHNETPSNRKAIIMCKHHNPACNHTTPVVDTIRTIVMIPFVTVAAIAALVVGSTIN